MIPVYYDNTNKVWRKADSANSNESYKWYDYDNKMWANAVTVASNLYLDDITSNKSVSLNNISLPPTANDTFTSGGKGITYANSMTKITVNIKKAGIFSFTAIVSSGQNAQLTVTVSKNSGTATTVADAISQIDSKTYSDTAVAGDVYVITAKYAKDYLGDANDDNGVLKLTYPENTTVTYTDSATAGGTAEQDWTASGELEATTGVTYGDSITYDESVGKYKINNISRAVISNSLVGKYVCPTTSDTFCTTPYKIVEASDTITKVDEYKIKAIPRSTYLKASVGTEIPMEVINTMWVWIPRYTYVMTEGTPDYMSSEYNSIYDDIYIKELKKMGYSDEEINEILANWKNGEDKGDFSSMIYSLKYSYTPGEINIKFENGVKSTGTISCVDAINQKDNNDNYVSQICTDTKNGSLKREISTYTHPGFTFGDTELTGLWVGKFVNSVTNPPQNHIDYEMPIIIKPNTQIYRFQYEKKYFYDIRQMERANNIYGFTQSNNTTINTNGSLSGDTNNIDTHSIKTTEWGALTYLSYSKYGMCTNGECEQQSYYCSNYITGTGAEYEATDISCTNDENKYNGAIGVKSSTTGNVYGVYDIGGHKNNFEHAMGYAITESTELPFLAKYYDAYTKYNGYTITKLGDALDILSLNEKKRLDGSSFYRDGLFGFNYSFYAYGWLSSRSVLSITK